MGYDFEAKAKACYYYGCTKTSNFGRFFYGAFAVTLVIGDQLFDNLLFNLDRDKMCNGLVVGLLGCCFAARLDY